MFIRFRLRMAVIALIAMALLSACSGKPTPAATAKGKPEAEKPATQQKTTMATGGISGMIYLPAALAAYGLFQEAGLDVTVTDKSGGADAAKALMSGEVEFASMALEHVIRNQVQGADLVMLQVYTNVPGYALLVDTKYKDQIKSPADLKARKVGVSSLGSGTHAYLQQVMRSTSIDANSLVVLPVGLGPTLSDALQTGKIDAAVAADPQVTQLVNDKKAFILTDARTQAQVEKLYGSEYPFVGLATRRDVLKKNPDLVKRMVQVVQKAQGMVRTAPAKEITAKLPASIKGSDEAVYVSALESSRGMFPADGAVTEKGLQTVVKAMQDQKAIGADVKIELNTVYVKP